MSHAEPGLRQGFGGHTAKDAEGAAEPEILSLKSERKTKRKKKSPGKP